MQCCAHIILIPSIIVIHMTEVHNTADAAAAYI